MTRRLLDWFKSRGWKPFPFQKEVWRLHPEGRQGLIHAPTGMGKTHAAWLAALAQEPPKDKLRVLWITPLRALAADTLEALREPVDQLGLAWRVEARTGDTPSSLKIRQRRDAPNALVTTPESLSLLLSYAESEAMFSHLRMIVVDEWHEQLGTKRGVQTELALARLRRFSPQVCTWGLSATIGNLDEALRVLLARDHKAGIIVQGLQPKEVRIDSLLPPDVRHFPWAGHLGSHLLPQVLDEVHKARCSLVFTNTRSQAERWYQMMLDAAPELAGEIAVHHGSLSREVREWVEQNLRAGRLRCVVCTSSLDLGVDFPNVDRVLQIGSPKGVARLLQRAGRSGHQPGSISHASCVPAHAFELVENCAAREAIAKGLLEARVPLEKPFDVLAQHIVTIACASGFEEEALLDEVRESYAYRDLTGDEWDWALGFVAHGGASLSAYPDYNKLTHSADRWRIASPQAAKRHRMNIGTITADNSVRIQYLSGGSLGTIEERFIGALIPGQTFVFAGKPLELIRVRNMTAFVKAASSTPGIVPAWMGSRMPLTSILSSEVRRKLDEARNGQFLGEEMEAARHVLERQQQLSLIPAKDELLIETLHRGGRHHTFLYPFEGRLVHEGLGPLLALRLSRKQPISIAITATDYAIELVSPDPIPPLTLDLFSPEHLAEDIAASMNAAELGRRQFREIARVAGLIFQGYPGQSKSARQLQASAGLLFDVFTQHDPGNLLLHQAHREVMENELDSSRLMATLQRIHQGRIVYAHLRSGSPLCFPILVDRIRASAVSSESVTARILKLQQRLERAA